MSLSLEPVELCVAAIAHPQFFGDGRYEAICQVNFLPRINGGSYQDPHGMLPSRASLGLDWIIMPMMGCCIYAESSLIGRR
jgi:hypothetical protein